MFTRATPIEDPETFRPVSTRRTRRRAGQRGSYSDRLQHLIVTVRRNDDMLRSVRSARQALTTAQRKVGAR